MVDIFLDCIYEQLEQKVFSDFFLFTFLAKTLLNIERCFFFLFYKLI